MHGYSFWIACQPDLSKPIGGVKQLHRLAECLTHLGYQATLIQDEKNFHPGWFSSNVQTTTRQELAALTSSIEAGCRAAETILILPETYIENRDAYFPQLKSIIFNQNFSYTFKSRKGILRPDAIRDRYCSTNVLGVWCVSDHDESCLLSWLGSRQIVSRIVNQVDTHIFRFKEQKSRLIAYMSRKNKEHAAIVRNILESMNELAGWTLIDIKGRSQAETAAIMADSAIFLSFGFPEGFGLPVAEALASGCAVVGYTGLGGRELFAMARCFGCADEVEYGDFLGFIRAVLHYAKRFEADQVGFMEDQCLTAKEVASNYSAACMLSSVQRALKAIGC